MFEILFETRQSKSGLETVSRLRHQHRDFDPAQTFRESSLNSTLIMVFTEHYYQPSLAATEINLMARSLCITKNPTDLVWCDQAIKHSQYSDIPVRHRVVVMQLCYDHFIIQWCTLYVCHEQCPHNATCLMRDSTCRQSHITLFRYVTCPDITYTQQYHPLVSRQQNVINMTIR